MSIDMAKTPLISLVVPFFNLEDCAERSINTFLAQTYTNCEFIFVDDGSTDKTPEILDDFAARDTRVHVVHKKNEGVAAARNAGASAANGKYVSFADGDDVISPWYLEVMQHAMAGRENTLVLACNKTIKAADVDSVSWSNPLSCEPLEISRGEG